MPRNKILIQTSSTFPSHLLQHYPLLSSTNTTMKLTNTIALALSTASTVCGAPQRVHTPGPASMDTVTTVPTIQNRVNVYGKCDPENADADCYDGHHTHPHFPVSSHGSYYLPGANAALPSNTTLLPHRTSPIPEYRPGSTAVATSISSPTNYVDFPCCEAFADMAFPPRITCVKCGPKMGN